MKRKDCLMKIRGFEKVSLNQWIKDYCNEFKDDERFATELYNSLSLPIQSTQKSAGCDLVSPISFRLQPNEEIKIPTGLKAYMQQNEMLNIYPRSGQGFKFYVRLANTVGIGDEDYYNTSGNEGHYWVKIRNEGNKAFKIERGERFAQAIFVPFLPPDEETFIASNKVRKNGLGHTGK